MTIRPHRNQFTALILAIIVLTSGVFSRSQITVEPSPATGGSDISRDIYTARLRACCNKTGPSHAARVATNRGQPPPMRIIGRAANSRCF